jgi:opacity protein-like surface antigen
MKKILQMATLALTLTPAALFAGSSDYAGTSYSDAPPVLSAPANPPFLFNAGEYFLDLGANYFEGSTFDQEFGYGVGGGYYFTRHIGVGADLIVFEESDDTDLSGDLHLLLRAPIDSAALALYGLVGVGFMTGDSDEFAYHFGAGVDVRLLDHLSVFLEARHIEREDFAGLTALRFGIRIVGW